MKTTTNDPRRITHFNFTYALAGGAWIRRANGAHNWESFEQIVREMGQPWIDRMLKKQGWMTGCEVAVD